MNFNELMNDDTCQILLAIIVGIVICYFIFGTGSCNKDGFSVGGQTCVWPGGPVGGAKDLLCGMHTPNGELACERALCRWNSATPLEVAGAAGRRCGQFILDMDNSMPDGNGSQPDCSVEQPAVAGIREECCFGKIPQTDGGITLMSDSNPNYLACSHPSNAVVKNKLNEFQTICQSNFSTGDTRVAAITDPPPPTGPELLVQNIKSDIEYQVSRITGEDPEILDFSTITDAYAHLNTYLTTSGTMVPDLVYDAGGGNIVSKISFVVLVNDVKLDGSPNPDKATLRGDSFVDGNQLFLPDFANFYNNHNFREGSGDKTGLIEMVTTYRDISIENQKEIYCNNYTLYNGVAGVDPASQVPDTSDPNNIDPLLKIVSNEMRNDPTCPTDSSPSGQMNFGSNINYNMLPIVSSGTQMSKPVGNELPKEIIKQISVNKGITVNDLGFLQNIPDDVGWDSDSYNSADVNIELLYSGRNTANTSVIDPALATIPDPLILEDNTFDDPKQWLISGIGGLSTDRGRSELRNYPYIQNTAVAQNLRMMPGGRYMDKYLHEKVNSATQIYKMNLFWLQYYFTRMFIGTDTYVPFNGFRKISNDPASTKTDITVNFHLDPDTYTLGDNTPFNVSSISADLTNISCQNSGTDYLLLVLIDKDVYDNAPELDYTGIDNTVNDGVVTLNNKREISSNGLYIVGNTIKKMTGNNSTGIHFFNNIVDTMPVLADSCNLLDVTGGTTTECSPISADSLSVNSRGIDGRGCKIDNGKCITDMNAPTGFEKNYFNMNRRADQITLDTLNEPGRQGDFIRYGINIQESQTCSADFPYPYTLPFTGPPAIPGVCDSNFCLSGYCIKDSSKIPEILDRLTAAAVTPTPTPTPTLCYSLAPNGDCTDAEGIECIRLYNDDGQKCAPDAASNFGIFDISPGGDCWPVYGTMKDGTDAVITDEEKCV
jgi:hypothetical protein